MIGLHLVLAAASLLSSAFTPYVHAQRLVDVGGRHINLYCTGSGSPAVILDTDGDDTTLMWRFVQPVLAKRTRVCSYDAPGLGFSDAAPPPHDAAAMAADLHRLLNHAGIRAPIVLVGDSLSGLSARIYADRYPRSVAGMVLVNPSIPYQYKRIAAVVPALSALAAGVQQYDQTCRTAAARGQIQPGTQFAQCIYTPPGPAVPVPLLNLIHRQWQTASLWNDVALADEASQVSSAEVVREQRRYGDMPLIVLSPDMTVSTAQMPIPKPQKLALSRAWLAWQDRIAHLSSRGVAFVVPGSDSSLEVSRPSSVVCAIDEVIYQVRGAK